MSNSTATPAEIAARRRATNLKSAQGTYFLALIMTVIYVVRAMIAENFRFYFCLFIPEVLFKSSAFTQTFDNDFSASFLSSCAGRIPAVPAWILLVACVGLFLTFGLLGQKKPLFLFGSLTLYALDSAALVAGRLLSLPEPMAEEGWIDLIFHAFVLFLLVVGAVTAVQDKKANAAA